MSGRLFFDIGGERVRVTSAISVYAQNLGQAVLPGEIGEIAIFQQLPPLGLAQNPL